MTADGFHFRPWDDEIIELFLEKRLLHGDGSVLWNPRLVDRNLYGKDADPWRVIPDDDPCWDTIATLSTGKSSNYSDDDDEIMIKNIKKVAYVFTRLSRKKNNSVGDDGTRFNRTAGCGTWDGKQDGKKIFSSTGRVIGTMKSFTFKKKNKDCNHQNVWRPKDERWIMHEYSLFGDSLSRFGTLEKKREAEQMVLCCISREYKEKIIVPHNKINATSNTNCVGEVPRQEPSIINNNPTGLMVLSGEKRSRSSSSWDDDDNSSKKKMKNYCEELEDQLLVSSASSTIIDLTDDIEYPDAPHDQKEVVSHKVKDINDDQRSPPSLIPSSQLIPNEQQLAVHKEEEEEEKNNLDHLEIPDFDSIYALSVLLDDFLDV